MATGELEWEAFDDGEWGVGWMYVSNFYFCAEFYLFTELHFCTELQFCEELLFYTELYFSLIQVLREKKFLTRVRSGVQYFDVAYGALYGFATFGTNAGHNGTSGGAFYQNPEVYEDFTWRAIYTGAQVGKAITSQFYDDDCGKSYYIGCSTGGRQGFKAVQQNPELFDGVVVGAPALDLSGHIAWWGHAYELMGFDPNNTLISLEQMAGIQAEVMKQCDGLDGAMDGILEDPSMCQFDWAPLTCPENCNSTASCLTPEQVQGAAQLFAPITYNNTFIHPGHYHGYEAALAQGTYLPGVADWVTEGYRDVLYDDPTWDPTTFTLKDAYNAALLNPSNGNSFDGDISTFRDRGGKILHWHGGADWLLAQSVSNRYVIIGYNVRRDHATALHFASTLHTETLLDQFC